MQLLKKIFIFTLILFPLGEIIRINLGNGLLVRPIDVSVLILSIIWFVKILLKKQKINRKEIYIPILLFSSSGLLSLVISNLNLSLNEFIISFLYLIRWIAYAGIFLIVINFDDKFKFKIVNILIGIGASVVVLGYAQYFFYSNLRNIIYLGWDEHMYRMFSVFLDPNFAGAFFVLFFIFLTHTYLKNKSRLIGFLSLSSLGAVFLTFSRSALIMLVVSSSLLFVLMNKKRLIIFIVLIIFTVLTISSRYFNIENINLFRIASSGARLETAGNALKIIENNPVFGVGFNAYRYAQSRYGLRDVQSNSLSHADAGTDNSFLFVIATTGIVGFGLFVLLWFNILKGEVRNPLLVASVAGVFVDSLFINSLFYPFIMFWLWVILALQENN